MDFSEYQAVFLDLDGTVYHEEHPLPGALELAAALVAEGHKFACLSNSTTSPLRIMDRLYHMGIDIGPDHIYTAAAAAADYVVDYYKPILEEVVPQSRPALFNLATESFGDMLEGLVDWVEEPVEPCDAVIAGTLVSMYATEERLRVALQLLRNGADLVGICADRVYPSPRGIEFGAGAVCALLAYAANRRPTFCGKPEPVFFHKLCQRLQVDPTQCILIGDNLEADILGAKGVGMKTILTLTGVSRRGDLASIPANMQPDVIVESLTELLHKPYEVNPDA